MSDRSCRMIAPWQVAEGVGAAYPIGFHYGDDLLPLAMIEFVGGLMQVFAAPEDEEEWLERWHRPPGPDELRAMLEPYARHFGVYGDTAAFQDRKADLGTSKSPGFLFCTSSSLSGPVSLQAAMAALACMQAHCTDGGRGHRNSIRGAGGLVTLPVVGHTLWHRIWSLVLPRKEFGCLGTGAVSYPWERDTDAKAVVLPSTHPASSLYLGMPRRFRLGRAGEAGRCPITGGTGPMVAEVLTEGGGESHPAERWTHPLTPYVYRRVDKMTGPVRGVHVTSGYSWGNRVGLLTSAPGNERTPSLIVTRWRDRIRDIREHGDAPPLLRIQAFGMQYDHTAVLGLVNTVVAFRLSPPRWEGAVEAHMERAVQAVSAVETILGLRISEALVGHKPEIGPDPRVAADRRAGRPKMADGAAGAAAMIWARTESAALAFQVDVEAAMDEEGQNAGRILDASRRLLRAARDRALEIFDTATARGFRESPQRLMSARSRVIGIHLSPSALEPLGLAAPLPRKAA